MPDKDEKKVVEVEEEVTPEVEVQPEPEPSVEPIPEPQPPREEGVGAAIVDGVDTRY